MKVTILKKTSTSEILKGGNLVYVERKGEDKIQSAVDILRALGIKVTEVDGRCKHTNKCCCRCHENGVKDCMHCGASCKLCEECGEMVRGN